MKFVRSERLKSGDVVDLYASPGRNADRNRNEKVCDSRKRKMQRE